MSKDAGGNVTVNEPWADYLRRVMRAAGFEPDGVRTGGRTELARAAGVSLSAISRSLNEGRTPDPDTLRALSAPLRVTYLDLLLAAGYLTEDELGNPKNAHNRAMLRYAEQRVAEDVRAAAAADQQAEGPRQLSVVRDTHAGSEDADEEGNEVLAAIRRDPDLDDSARAHFLNQYVLLRDLSRLKKGDTELLPYVAHGKRSTPVDPDEEAAIEARTRDAVRENPDSPHRDK